MEETIHQRDIKLTAVTVLNTFLNIVPIILLEMKGSGSQSYPVK